MPPWEVVKKGEGEWSDADCAFDAARSSVINKKGSTDKASTAAGPNDTEMVDVSKGSVKHL